MKSTQRALRRHHVQRLKRVRQFYWGSTAHHSAKRIHQCVITACVCSCHYCGNQRRHFGKSHCEKRQMHRHCE